MKKHALIKTIILLIIATLACFSCSGSRLASSQKAFSEIRTGKFSYKDKNLDFIVERTEDHQVEYNDKIGYKIEFEIKWLSDKEYNMIFIGGTKGCLQPGDIINVKIGSATAKGYKYVAYSERCGGITIGELIKIKENRHTKIQHD